MRRIALGAMAGFALAAAVVLAMLLTPLATHDGVGCGSVLVQVKPDPTWEREFGCGDLSIQRRGWTLLAGLVAGPLLTGIGAAVAASTVALGRGRRPDPEPFAP